MYEFESGIWPGPSGASGATSSSPVDRMAHSRPPVDPDPRVPQGRQHTERGGTQDGPRLQHPVARVDVLAPGAHVGAFLDGPPQHDAVAVPAGLLLRHDRVAPGRHRRARQDAVRLPRLELPEGSPSGGHLADDGERHRMGVAGRPRVGGAERVAVHRRVVPGRDLPRGHDGIGQDAAERLGERDALGAQDGHAGQTRSRASATDSTLRAPPVDGNG